MNNLKVGDILYYSFFHNKAICIARLKFGGWEGNRMVVRCFTAGFDTLKYPSEQQHLFKTPLEAFEDGLKKYADVW